MKFNRIFLLLLIATVLFGCASPVKKITDPTKPLESYHYAFFPPQDGEWSYVFNEDVGKTTLMLGKKSESPTHSTIGIVQEIYSEVSYENPEDLLAFIKQLAKLETDPRRFKLTKEIYELKKAFKSDVVFNYTVAEDNAARNLGDEDYLVMRTYGYVIPHPDQKQVMVKIDYSERGKAAELDPNFEEKAEEFYKGLRLITE